MVQFILYTVVFLVGFYFHVNYKEKIKHKEMSGGYFNKIASCCRQNFRTHASVSDENQYQCLDQLKNNVLVTNQ